MTENDKLTEEKIFESATEVFITKGMDGARMHEIAHHAGINRSLLHYYYRTKDRLFNAVFEKIAMKMIAKFAPVFDEKLSLDDKIRFFFREHISFLQRNPRLPIFLLNEMNRNPERITRFLNTLDVDKIWSMLYNQHRDELEKYNITRESMPQLMTTIVSMSIFPFAARGLLEGIFKKIEINFDDYLEERKNFAADFVIRSLKNKKP